MAVIAKIGLFEHRGKVRTEAGVFEVVRTEDDWYSVGGPAAEGSGHVRYDEDRQIIHIERPGVTLTIDFDPEPKRTIFQFQGHVYEVGSMDWGEISIKEGSRPVVRGHVTISGVRLVLVAPELLSVERELAFGLALRGAALDEDFWQAEHVYTEWSKDRVEDAVLREEEKRRGEL